MRIKYILLIGTLIFGDGILAVERKDPTQPAQAKVKQVTIDPQTLKVNLIKRSKDFNAASLNGEIVYQGGKLADIYVKDIQPDKVILRGTKEGVIQLKLWEEDQKTKSNEKELFPDVKTKHEEFTNKRN